MINIKQACLKKIFYDKKSQGQTNRSNKQTFFVLRNYKILPDYDMNLKKFPYNLTKVFVEILTQNLAQIVANMLSLFFLSHFYQILITLLVIQHFPQLYIIYDFISSQQYESKQIFGFNLMELR